VRLPRPNAFWIALAVFGAVVALILLPNVVPAVDPSGGAFELIAVLLLLALVPSLLAASALAWLVVRARRSESALPSRLFEVACASLLASAAYFVGNQLLRSELPPGSYLADYNRVAWLAPESAAWVRGDITPRQKMLADVVDRLPGRTRAEIEAMLGPSETEPYFAASSRDLIYRTGIERGSFFAIDSEWLLIWVDEAGRFERYEIAQD
jgi:hypothetical protein